MLKMTSLRVKLKNWSKKTFKGQKIDRFSNKVAEGECEISSKPNSILEGKQQEQKLQNLKRTTGGLQ